MADRLAIISLSFWYNEYWSQKVVSVYVCFNFMDARCFGRIFYKMWENELCSTYHSNKPLRTSVSPWLKEEKRFRACCLSVILWGPPRCSTFQKSRDLCIHCIIAITKDPLMCHLGQWRVHLSEYPVTGLLLL